MEAIVLQVEARHGRVAEFARSSGQGLTVGRAYDNDLVLTDLHVAPHQLHFFKEGTHWFFDVIDAVNPVLLNKRPVNATNNAVGPGDEITIGRTRLHVFPLDHTVEPTRQLMLSSWLALENTGPILPLLALIGVSLVDLVINYFYASTNLKWMEQVYGVLFSALICAVWAGLWAIAGRILRHQHHFGLQLIVVSGFSMLMTFLAIAANYIAFYAFDAGVEEFLSWFIYALALLILFRLNFMIATNVQRPLLASVIATTTLLGVVYGFYYPWDDEEIEYAPEHSAILLPPPLVLGSGETAQAYFSELGEAFADSEQPL
ncbi:MAG: FHA domain-containing protein [Gammaproteobacteria bacterium]|nr:FHA domain-containing protein [Gammaproteobacteria bacterium]